MLYLGYLSGDIRRKINLNRVVIFIMSVFFMGAMCVLVAKTQNYVNLYLFQIGNPIVFILTSVLGSFGIIMLCYTIEGDFVLNE